MVVGVCGWVTLFILWLPSEDVSSERQREIRPPPVRLQLPRGRELDIGCEGIGQRSNDR